MPTPHFCFHPRDLDRMTLFSVAKRSCMWMGEWRRSVRAVWSAVVSQGSFDALVGPATVANCRWGLKSLIRHTSEHRGRHHSSAFWLRRPHDSCKRDARQTPFLFRQMDGPGDAMLQGISGFCFVVTDADKGITNVYRRSRGSNMCFRGRAVHISPAALSIGSGTTGTLEQLRCDVQHTHRPCC